ncbi:hypothetical protein HU811_02105 [Pseudomonas sp. SWRI196]|uniref:Uncharacterized protein n=1 Tax=Pseudomonas tehranensis TaxID=2745502 RepID=A0ABR6ULZ2_9PSED|nr:hypothetical protein [Pseudomonas tehranensis]MBC3345427.1 hypothetical protein [Pseudomonas tehranensis]
MSFEAIQTTQFDLTRNAAFHAGQMKSFAASLSKSLNELLNSEVPTEQWGTSAAIGSDGITLRVSTPFGEARAVSVVYLSGGYIGLRYVFEKLVTAAGGEAIFQPVWAVRISGEGKVVSDDGADPIFSMRAISANERDNGVVTVALSALYAIATDQGYYVADEEVG